MKRRSCYHFVIVLFVILLPCLSYGEETYKFKQLWPGLPQPWYFSQPMNAAVNSDGYIYVADKGNYRIQKFTADGYFITEWNPLNRMNPPISIAIDSAGVVYVICEGYDKVRKFTSDGKFISEWQCRFPEDAESFNPSNITIDNKDTVWLRDSYHRRVYKFTSDGRRIRKWTDNGSNGSEQFPLPDSIATDSSGFVYVTDMKNNGVQKYDADGKFIARWGSEGSGDGQFRQPYGIAVFNNSVYVGDIMNQRVQVFDLNGNFLAKFGSGQFYSPSGITVNKNGFLYVADANRRGILKFASNGVFVSAWQSLGSNPGMFEKPRGAAISKDGSVYIADANNHRIQKFDPAGAFITQWGLPGSDNGQMDTPYGVAVDADNTVYVADTLNNRIQKFDADGKFLAVIGSQGTGHGQFDNPEGIAIDSQGFIYVSDTKNRRIQKFDATGIFQKTWGSPDSEFFAPSGIAVFNNFVYVADRDNDRIYQFDSDGQFKISWDASGSGIAADTLGNVYVADDRNNRVQKFTPDGKFLVSFGEFGSGPGQLRKPMGLAVNAGGSVYVSDSENNRIQVFQKSGATDKISKAIIVAGGGPYPGNKLWDSTRIAANAAYQTLNYQGFGKKDIRYFSHDTADLDNNGQADDFAGIPSGENIRKAMSEWAADADMLVVYLTDHGGEGRFVLSGTETVSAESLRDWLNESRSQTKKSKEIIVIYDACKSGTFHAPFASISSPRILMTSTAGTEDAYFISQGMISFSGFFWTNIFSGYPVKAAFDAAQTAVRNIIKVQLPKIDNQGIPEDRLIGQGTKTNGDAPAITDASFDGGILRVKVTDEHGVSRVWAVMKPGDNTQSSSGSAVTDMPSSDLVPAGNGEYIGQDIMQGSVMIYAKDAVGNMSAIEMPGQGSLLRRKAVIVSGAGRKGATVACNALKSQWYQDADIVFLADSPLSCKNNGAADKQATLSNLKDALSDVSNVRDMTLYLTGTGTSGTFRINDKETLTAPLLAQWLGELQGKITGKITVIYDADYPGNFLSALSGKNRIVIVSASPGQQVFSDKDMSFSGFFWNAVAAGAGVGKAFSDARNAVGFLSGVTPEIDDPDSLASAYHIGNGIKMADTVAIPPDMTLSGQTSAPIRAEDGSGNMTGAWVMITRPGCRFCKPVKLDLSPENGVYQAMYNDFKTFGNYHISVYARDKSGNISLPKETEIYQTGGQDVYESDNDAAHAGYIVISDTTPQEHNFGSAGDQDWVKFCGVAGQTYTFRASGVGKKCNPIFEIYDNNLRLLKSWQSSGEDIAKEWVCGQDGVYYVKIKNGISAYGEGTGYKFEIYTPTAALPGFVTGLITDEQGNPIKDAQIITDANGSALSFADGQYIMNQPAGGKITLTVKVEGYSEETVEIIVSEGGLTSQNFRMNPIQPIVEPQYQQYLFTAEDRGSIAVGEDLTLNICARYQGMTFGLTMTFAPNPHGLSGVFWKADPATLKQIQSFSLACIDVGDDLKMNIRAEYRGVGYAFPMSFYPYPNAASASEFFWKADPASLRVIY